MVTGFVAQRQLFKLDRSRWLTRQIIEYSVDSFHLVYNSVHDFIQYFVWNFCCLGCHEIDCLYSSEGYCIIICSEISHNSYTSHICKCCKVLVNITIKSSFCNLFSVDCISVLNNSYFLSCYFSDNSDSKSRSWEWLTKYQVFWNSKFKSSFSYLIFKQVAERLNDFFEINVVRKSSYVMMRFDNCGFSAKSALYNVRIYRSLCLKQNVRLSVKNLSVSLLLPQRYG